MEEKNFRSITSQEVIDAMDTLKEAVDLFEKRAYRHLMQGILSNTSLPDNTLARCQALLFIDTFGDLKKAVSMISDLVGDTEKEQDFFNRLLKKLEVTPEELESKLMMKAVDDILSILVRS